MKRLKRLLKWSAVALGALVGIVGIAAAVFHAKGTARLDRTYAIDVPAVAIPSDSATVARGRHLARAVALCHACHGDDLSGDLIFEEPGIATLYASNLTSGRGGVGATYSDADFVRAIRHGVSREGKGLLIMHSDAYNRLGSEDLAAIIAFLKSLPPVDRDVPGKQTSALGRIMIGLGLFDVESMPLIPAERIDHDRPVPDSPPHGVTVEYGEYLVSLALCAMCHGRDLQGGPPIAAGAPAAPNIVAYTAAGAWSEAQFASTIRTGVTPSGKALDGEHMPWQVYANMTDEELSAIWMYMASLDRRSAVTDGSG